MKAVSVMGRILFGGFFLYSGINHIREKKSMVAYAGAKGVPMPEQSVDLATLLLLIGGTSVMLGLKPKLGNAAIVTFLAAVTPMMHDFWEDETEEAEKNNMIHYGKNMALLGAALALAANAD